MSRVLRRFIKCVSTTACDAPGPRYVPGKRARGNCRIAVTGFHFLQRLFVGGKVFGWRGDVEAGRRHGVEETGGLQFVRAGKIADVLKPGVLTDAQRRVIDQVGNNNGRYDVGDLRAFLLQTTTISAGAAYSVR